MPTSVADFAQSVLTGGETAAVIAGKMVSASYKTADVESALLENSSTYATYMGQLIGASKTRDGQYTTAHATNALSSVETQVANMAHAGDAKQKDAADTYRRQFEINEWTAANRQETLFVFQFIFFAIIVLTILASLYRMNIVSGAFTSFASFGVLFVMVMVIVYRAQYTAFKRDKRYWNKRRFDRGAGPIFAAPNCPAITDFAANLPGNIESSLKTGVATGLGGLGSSLSSLGGALTSAGGGLSSTASQFTF